MTAAKNSDESSRCSPLLPEAHPPHSHPPPQYIVVLPPHLPSYRTNRLNHRCYRRGIICSAVLLIFVAASYVLWPSDPKISVVRLSLGGLHFHTTPKLSIDLTLDLTVKVWNKDFYSIDYDTLKVEIGYRGRRLGFMTSDGGRVKARRSSYVNATLELDGAEVLDDAVALLKDLLSGSITFDTESQITGKLGLLFFNLSLKATISCEVIVNTRNQTIKHQNCYPD